MYSLIPISSISTLLIALFATRTYVPLASAAPLSSSILDIQSIPTESSTTHSVHFSDRRGLIDSMPIVGGLGGGLTPAGSTGGPGTSNNPSTPLNTPNTSNTSNVPLSRVDQGNTAEVPAPSPENPIAPANSSTGSDGNSSGSASDNQLGEVTRLIDIFLQGAQQIKNVGGSKPVEQPSNPVGGPSNGQPGSGNQL